MIDILSESESLKWLHKPLLERCLRNYLNNNRLNIVDFKLKSATAKGENYASQIYRVSVVYSNETLEKKNVNLILKIAFQGGFAFDTLSACNVYEKEADFYDIIAPEIRQLLRNVNETEQLLPETIYINKANHAMIFDDLVSKGYRLMPLQPGFNKLEAQMILSKMASYHAACAVLKVQKPKIFEKEMYYTRGHINLCGNSENNFFLTQLNALLDVISTWPDFAYYTRKLSRVRDNFFEKACQTVKADPNGFNTLVHSDLWTNNVMMKYGSTSDAPLENAIFLDFQLAFWSSPVIDLHFFLHTSLHETLRSYHLSELIEYYHNKLITMLQRFNYSKYVPTLRELESEFREKSFHGFMSSCLVQPILRNENKENADIEALLLNDERSREFKRLMYSSSKVHDNLLKLIPFFDSMGAFDVG